MVSIRDGVLEKVTKCLGKSIFPGAGILVAAWEQWLGDARQELLHPVLAEAGAAPGWRQD